jgi:hypothetical protein
MAPELKRQDTEEAESAHLTPCRCEAPQSHPVASHAPPAPLPLAPRMAELVECADSGQFYLRAFQKGRYLWQPVAGPGAAIRDSGVWLAGGTGSIAYWHNHGAYRRRSRYYYALHGPNSPSRSA